MSTLTHIDLRHDSAARSYIKDEIVHVEFATAPGEIQSREGPNGYAAGDALITGSTGDKWSVTRDRFDAKYDPTPPTKHGENGAYRSKRLPVLAKQMQQAFSIARAAGSDVIHGQAGDWLMQYAPGDYGIVEEAKFRKVYRAADAQ